MIPATEVPVTMRWGIIGTEALSPRLRPEARGLSVLGAGKAKRIRSWWRAREAG